MSDEASSIERGPRLDPKRDAALARTQRKTGLNTMDNMPETTPDEPLSQRLRLAIMAVVEVPSRATPQGPQIKALLDVGEEAAQHLEAAARIEEDRPRDKLAGAGPFTPDGLLKAERDRLKVELESALARANESEEKLEILRGLRETEQKSAEVYRSTLSKIYEAVGVESLSTVLATIKGARDQAEGENAAIREERRLAAEAEKLKGEIAKLKASNGRLESRAVLVTNKATRRAEESAQLSRAMVELGMIIGEERVRARDAWEAVAQERERADHQEARKEDQIFKLAQTIDARVEEDERVKAWEQVVKHPAFVPCYESDGALLPAVIARLDELLATANLDAVLTGQADQ